MDSLIYFTRPGPLQRFFVDGDLCLDTREDRALLVRSAIAILTLNWTEFYVT